MGSVEVGGDWTWVRGKGRDKVSIHKYLVRVVGGGVSAFGRMDISEKERNFSRLLLERYWSGGWVGGRKEGRRWIETWRN